MTKRAPVRGKNSRMCNETEGKFLRKNSFEAPASGWVNIPLWRGNPSESCEKYFSGMKEILVRATRNILGRQEKFLGRLTMWSPKIDYFCFVIWISVAITSRNQRNSNEYYTTWEDGTNIWRLSWDGMGALTEARHFLFDLKDTSFPPMELDLI